MKLRFVAVSAVVCCAMGLSLWLEAAPAVADGPQTGAAGTAQSTMDVGDDKYAYVGSKACKMCHMTQHKSWAKTKMAKAFELLKPDQAVEAKKKHGLDPKKDYTTDKTCLPCHVTGYGKKGGYDSLKADDKNLQYYQGVGCESCHGPGEQYNKIHKQIMKSKRKYKAEEFYAIGMTKVDADVCKQCHNDKSPTIDADTPFDFDKRKDQDSHDHKPLKYKDG